MVIYEGKVTQTTSKILRNEDGYEIKGVIKFPKFGTQYTVLSEVTKRSIEKNVAIVYGPGLNEIGNTVIVGHNYKRTGVLFSDINKLSDGKNGGQADKIIIKDQDKSIHTNRINEKYLTYLSKIEEIKYITYDYDISMPFISDTYNIIDNQYLNAISNKEFIKDNYDIIYGTNISNRFDILLKIDSNNNVDSKLLNYFNIDQDINYQDIVGRKIRVITNDNYYLKLDNYYVINQNNKYLYDNSELELTIVGIVKEKEVTNDNSQIYYDKSLLELLFDINQNSNIVKDQIIKDYNVLGLHINKNDMLSYLGYHSIPYKINIYVNNLESKDKVIKLLDSYNENNQKLIYVDTMASAINIVRNFITIISTVLLSFSVVAIIISSLMIGIITNVRVLERKKEIGILRSIGTSKKDIKNLFNIENIIIGIIAMIIAIIIIYILKNPINYFIKKTMDIDNIFNVNYLIMLIVFIINIIIIKISGTIPAKKASSMDIVSCIYNR